jgi:hypothetical protein
MQFKSTIAGLACLLVAAPFAGATTLKQMNLADLSGRAGRVFRGTVVAIDRSTVAAGGGELPIVTYRLRVTDALKGDFAAEGGATYAEVRMVDVEPSGEPKAGVRRVSIFRDVPRLQKGREYLLFTTTPSRIGLSTTVGLGQGAFRIEGQGDKATAVNEFGNAGLFNRMTPPGALSARPARGPVAYSDIAARVRGLVGQ